MSRAKKFSTQRLVTYIPKDYDIITMGALYARTVTFPPCVGNNFRFNDISSELAYSFLIDRGDPSKLLKYMLCGISSEIKRVKVIGMLIAFRKVRLELLREVILALKYFVCTNKMKEVRFQQLIAPFKNLYLCFCQNNINHLMLMKYPEAAMNVKSAIWDVSPLKGWNTASTIYGTHCYTQTVLEEMNKKKKIFSPEIQTKILGYYHYFYVRRLMRILLGVRLQIPLVIKLYSNEIPILKNAPHEWFELMASIGNTRIFTNLMIHGISFNDNYLEFVQELKLNHALPIFRYIEYLTKTQIMKPLTDSIVSAYKKRRV